MSNSNSKMAIKIRKATINDAEGVANVLLNSYNMSNESEAKEAFFSEMKKGFVYIVAEDPISLSSSQNPSILGIVTYFIHGIPKHGLAELDRIAMLPNYRGKGIGKMLFNELISHLKEEYKIKHSALRKLYLLTHEDNKDARAFYEKLGLKHETTLKSHYYTSRDECVYSMFFEN